MYLDKEFDSDVFLSKFKYTHDHVQEQLKARGQSMLGGDSTDNSKGVVIIQWKFKGEP